MRSFWIVLFFLFSNPYFSFSQPDEVSMFIFGHSLIDHRPPGIPTPSDETTVPHWMFDIATQQGNSFSAGGQFGFLPQHANLPPISQIGYDNVPGVWEEDYETFSETNINTILMTAANFIQFTPSDQAHPLDYSTSVTNATIEIIDWVSSQRGEEIQYYIYANWPEMDLQNPFPPTIPSQGVINEYHDWTRNSFLDWWTDYQDFVLDLRPQYSIKLIPVGPIMSGVMTEVIPGQVPFDEWYEDSAPHGRPNLYYLASLITYMSVYEEPVRLDIEIDDQIHPAIRDNVEDIIEYIWSELNAFNFSNGESRVFNDVSVSIRDASTEQVKIFPNPADELIYLKGVSDNLNYEIYNCRGKIVMSGLTKNSINVSALVSGLYFLRLSNDQIFIKTGKFYRL